MAEERWPYSCFLSSMDINDLYIVAGEDGEAQIMVLRETRNTVLGVLL